jgi:prepilin peptidase CpaA
MDASLVNHFVIALFVGLLALAAVSDVVEYRIPNRIVLAITALYPVHVLAASHRVDWTGALLVMAVVFAGGFVLFASGRLGGGDVKLATATALWAGPAVVLDYLLVTALVGGVMGLVMATKYRFALALAIDPAGKRGFRDVLLSDVMPYGVAIAMGGFLVAGRLLGT